MDVNQVRTDVMQTYDPEGVVEAGADNSDSDYDPSGPMQVQTSLPQDLGQPLTASSFLAPPPTSTSRPSSTVAQPSATPLPDFSKLPQNPPAQRGGFIDDDDDENVDEDDIKDNVDVYETSEVADVGTPAAAVNTLNPLDSTSHVQIQAASNAPAESSLLSNGVSDVASSSFARSGPSPLPQVPTPIQVPQSNIASGPGSVSATPTSAVPKARLAHDTVGILEDRIKEDPRGDIPAWLDLITEHKNRNKRDEARKVYQRFFEYFPISVSPARY